MPAQPPTTQRKHFVLAGMPRAGTTYVYHALAAHPDAFVPFRKELRFFSLNYNRGRDWYDHFYADAEPGSVLVDTSPDYFMDPAAPARIRGFSPEIKVALAVRDPAAWAVSLHRQLGTHKRKVPRFADFLVQGNYLEFDLPWWGRKPELRFALQNGFVRNQLAAFCAALGERLLLYDFAWFERDPLAVLRQLESFAGMTPFFSEGNLPDGRINARGRENIRWLSYLSSRDVLINTAGSLLPRRWLIAVRMKMDRASNRDSRHASDPRDAADLALARDVLAADCASVKSRFAASPQVLGNGRVDQPPSN